MFSWLGSLVDKLLGWFVSTPAWVIFAKHWMAYFTFRCFGYPKFPLENYFTVQNIINEQTKDGIYAFVSGDPSQLSFIVDNLFTGCAWGHAGIVRVENGQLYAYHMKSAGLDHWSLLDIMHQCDRFALLRLPIEGDNIAIANARLDALIAANPPVQYNFQFGMSDAVVNALSQGGPLTTTTTALLQTVKLYCSELDFMMGVGLVDDPQFASKYAYGVEVFEPDDLYAASQILFELRAA